MQTKSPALNAECWQLWRARTEAKGEKKKNKKLGNVVSAVNSLSIDDIDR
jgi:hypothetical protein